MRLRILCAGALALFAVSTALAQVTRPLDHDAYERWQYVSDTHISHDGQWAIWREAPDTVGDGRVVVRSTNGRTTYHIARGDDARLSADGRFAVALVHPPYDSTRSAKVARTKKADLPKDSLVVLDLTDGARTGYADVKSFALSKDARSVLAVMFEPEESDSTDACLPAAEDAKRKKLKKQDGTRLYVRDLVAGESFHIHFAREYVLTDDGNWLVYATESEDGEFDGAFAMRTTDGSVLPLLTGTGLYRKVAVSKDGSQAAFVSNTTDFESDQPEFLLYQARLGAPADAVSTDGIPADWWVSEHAELRFSDSGRRLFFGTAPRPAYEEEDKRPDEEKVEIDIWNWRDPLLQPMQLVRQERELKRSYAAVVEGDRVVQLATESIPDVNLLKHGDGSVVIGTSNMPYRQEISWDSPGYSDLYAIDVSTGRARQLKAGIQSSVTPSPDGSHVAWWDRETLEWKISDTASGGIVVASANVVDENELHDWPFRPSSYGAAGWLEDGSRFVFYDRFDLWAADSNGGAPELLTGGYGRANNIRLRYEELDPEADGLSTSAPWLLSSFDEKTKSEGFFAGSADARHPRELTMLPVNFGRPIKARDADRLILTRETFRDPTDLWTADMGFRELRNLSMSNPQQSEYTWGTVELVSWTSVDGERLEGLLYKPDGFDPATKYPLMVNFYERNSDRLHRYHPVRASRSSVGYSFYVSRGYLLFVPDIPYKVGYPGESAMNAVMPGVTHLIQQGFVDPERIGVQGHSWGGYQIAYMITQTNLFAAAEAGAPVVNMTSAYGGIRWGSGMSRMFQYEMTQSRIGGSLWDAPLRYIDNSPLFQADKIETPVMFMHNDSDGAVPWYQGIEFFVALRRLNKPVWMLNYNGQDHGLSNYFDRKDFSIRMQQFFDHYLMDAPAPIWKTQGIPAVMKGKTMGLDFDQ